MLSAFTAHLILELRQRDKAKIESILAYGDRLLVGLSTGSLRIYRVNEPQEDKLKDSGSASPSGQTVSRPGSSSTSKPVELLRELEKFSTRAVEQLARIKEANILISLSNYYISIHDLQSYTLQEQLLKTKNATTFAVTTDISKDSATGIPEIISRLAVAVKRRLLLWSWHDSEMSQHVVEIALSESIRSLTWASATNIICGMNSGYVIVDVLTQTTEEVVGPGADVPGGRFGVGPASMGYMGLGGYISKPLATKLADGEMLLAKDVNSMFIASDGKPIVEKKHITWTVAPDVVGYSYPYILALQNPSKGSLEVRNPDTSSLLQSISLPNSSQLHFPPPGVSLAHAGKGFHVMSDRCIWGMGATDYDSQVDELVEKGQYDEAISLLNMLEDALLVKTSKEHRLREVKIQKAQLLFDERKYRKAMNIFMAPDVQAPPERVIKLYPRIIAGDLSIIKAETRDAPELEASNGHPRLDAVTTDAQEYAGTPKPAALSKLLHPHKKAVSDDSSIRSIMRLDSDEAGDSATAEKKQVVAPLEGEDLTNAALELNQFLVQTRNTMKQFIDAETGKLLSVKSDGQNGASEAAFDSLLDSPASEADKYRERNLRETARLIDTTLFRSYMLVRPGLAGPFFRIPNFCDPDVVKEKLLESNRYNDLVDFFYGKKLHRPALELLQQFGTADEEDENAPTLHGPQRTVGYLANLPPEMIDLILEFVEWPIRVNPHLGMEIFLADTENAETLPREKVANFLESIDIDLEVRYLEHVINELDDTALEFHDRLAHAYVSDLKKHKDVESDDWKNLMERLISFLRLSNQYSLSKALANIPSDDPKFYEAQAVLLSNMGQDKEALEIYVFKLKNFEKAEEYCNRVHLTASSANSSPLQTRRPSTSHPGTSDEDGSMSIYHILLALYLKPPPPYQPNWAPALSLLSKHGSRLPAISTLNLIPKALPIAELESYFRGRIRSANSIMNEARIEVELRKGEVVNAQAELLLGEGPSPVGGGNLSGKGGRGRRVVVGEDRVCGICHKRLGGSVVAVLPGNEVVHYGCMGRNKGGVKTGNWGNWGRKAERE
ncbi:vacuolar morphogenesis protein-like protein AvaB [Calycina marina]|uniref:Vacuolar morphogenesis protein-like protein AvaB n=1 Tax=Calycina marina TaxID=1763456 RepID=A0A9P8CJ77_9HELO|nr:vacuolar morphogenesis protein-like protein AvaB [Calycina marina]